MTASGSTDRFRALSLLLNFALAAGVLTLVMMVGAKPAEAVLPGANGLFAFASNAVTPTNVDGDYEIFKTNPNGSQQTRLTKNLDGNFLPTWSPDGKRIEFRSKWDGNSEIYLMSGAGGSSFTQDPYIDRRSEVVTRYHQVPAFTRCREEL